MTTRAPLFRRLGLAESIPPDTPHAVSVSLPTWQDNIDYEEGAAHVHDAMRSGYPRFFIHASIQRLATYCLLLEKAAIDERCLLLPAERPAQRCYAFVKQYGTHHAALRIACRQFGDESLYLVIVSQADWPVVRAYWQHTGEGISSRFAEHCLREAGELPVTPEPVSTATGEEDGEAEVLLELATYVEERFGRNLCRQQAGDAKRWLRERIANAVAGDAAPDAQPREPGYALAPVTAEHVYIYPCGMSAIFNTHRLLRVLHPDRKSVCYGFPYIDTLKILEKFGAGCHFLGHATLADLDRLEHQLSVASDSERILAVFCEFPGNPLLKSPDLKRLRALADRFQFAVVVDDTVGGFANLELMPWVDVLVSSLTKIFSGDSNVMGGSVVVNTARPIGRQLQHVLQQGDGGDGLPGYEDNVWCEDAIFLERNSRNFARRCERISRTTEALCDYLRIQPQVAEVYYPKYVDRTTYDAFRRPTGGYGGLFSLVLCSPARTPDFYDALACAKGPSLGTNFTLACPYTLLAHYTELDWAAEFGVSKYLVRVSVGLEEFDRLRAWFDAALAAV